MTTRDETCAVLEARAGMYDTLAGLYFHSLSQEQIDAMAAADYTELMNDDNPLIASGFNDIYRYLRKRNTGTHQELSVDFSSCFLGTHTYKGLSGQPYESLFTDAGLRLNGAPRGAVHRAYKAEGVALRTGYDYPDDHLAFECEFMSVLCRRTIEALEADDEPEARRLLDVQRDFMSEHICAWFRRLHDLALKFVKTRFYRGVLDISQGFFDGEIETIDDLRWVLEEGFEEPEGTDDAADAEGAEGGEDAADEGAEDDVAPEGAAGSVAGAAGASGVTGAVAAAEGVASGGADAKSRAA